LAYAITVIRNSGDCIHIFPRKQLKIEQKSEGEKMGNGKEFVGQIIVGNGLSILKMAGIQG